MELSANNTRNVQDQTGQVGRPTSRWRQHWEAAILAQMFPKPVTKGNHFLVLRITSPSKHLNMWKSEIKTTSFNPKPPFGVAFSPFSLKQVLRAGSPGRCQACAGPRPALKPDSEHRPLCAGPPGPMDCSPGTMWHKTDPTPALRPYKLGPSLGTHPFSHFQHKKYRGWWARQLRPPPANVPCVSDTWVCHPV